MPSWLPEGRWGEGGSARRPWCREAARGWRACCPWRWRCGASPSCARLCRNTTRHATAGERGEGEAEWARWALRTRVRGACFVGCGRCVCALAAVGAHEALQLGDGHVLRVLRVLKERERHRRGRAHRRDLRRRRRHRQASHEPHAGPLPRGSPLCARRALRCAAAVAAHLVLDTRKHRLLDALPQIVAAWRGRGVKPHAASKELPRAQLRGLAA